MNKIALIVLLTLSIGLLGYLYQTKTNNQKNIELTKSKDKYEVIFEEVNYYQNVKGFLAKPKNPGNYPGVIMIHEWWGLNENIKEMAKQLAGQGYIVLAVDLFGTVATTPEEARKQTSSLNQEEAIKNMNSAKEYIQKEGAKKIGSLGWCFGGAQSLQISVNQDLDATVIYYGNLIEDNEKLKNLKSPVLGIFGDQDAQIPTEKVLTFEKNLQNLSVKNNIHIYQGVGHAFANPSGQNYAPEQTKDAWSKTLKFLEENLK